MPPLSANQISRAKTPSQAFIFLLRLGRQRARRGPPPSNRVASDAFFALPAIVRYAARFGEGAFPFTCAQGAADHE